MENLSKLCQPASKKYSGLPFVPVRAIPIDMFPHTPHCELVLVLERGCTLAQSLKASGFGPDQDTQKNAGNGVREAVESNETIGTPLDGDAAERRPSPEGERPSKIQRTR